MSNLENSRQLEGWLRRRETKDRSISSSSVEHGPGDVYLIRLSEITSSGQRRKVKPMAAGVGLAGRLLDRARACGRSVKRIFVSSTWKTLT